MFTIIQLSQYAKSTKLCSLVQVSNNTVISPNISHRWYAIYDNPEFHSALMFALFLRCGDCTFGTQKRCWCRDPFPFVHLTFHGNTNRPVCFCQSQNYNHHSEGKVQTLERNETRGCHRSKQKQVTFVSTWVGMGWGRKKKTIKEKKIWQLCRNRWPLEISAQTDFFTLWRLCSWPREKLQSCEAAAAAAPT
jgi:hypothetical protein